MKSIQNKLLFAIFVVLIAISGCEEDPGNITGIIFNENEGNSSSNDVPLNIIFRYDSNGNNIANWNEMIGLDVSVRNATSQTIRNVSIQITSITPSSVWSLYDSDAKIIGTIAPNASVSPTTYWCFNCDSSSEIRIGHFYIDLASGSGSTSMSVNFQVNYTDGQGRGQVGRQTYTMTVR